MRDGFDGEGSTEGILGVEEEREREVDFDIAGGFIRGFEGFGE